MYDSRFHLPLISVVIDLTKAFPFAVVEILLPSSTPLVDEVSSHLNSSIVIAPVGGISTSLPYVAVGSHVILMDFYVDHERYGYKLKESASMDVNIYIF